MTREEIWLERARLAEELGFDAEPFHDMVKLALLLGRYDEDLA